MFSYTKLNLQDEISKQPEFIQWKNAAASTWTWCRVLAGIRKQFHSIGSIPVLHTCHCYTGRDIPRPYPVGYIILFKKIKIIYTLKSDFKATLLSPICHENDLFLLKNEVLCLKSALYFTQISQKMSPSPFCLWIFAIRGWWAKAKTHINPLKICKTPLIWATSNGKGHKN